MYVRFVDYQGKQILYLDFAGVKTEQDALERISEGRQFIAAQPPNSLLTLTDSRNSVFNRKVSDELRDYTKHNKPFVKAAALLGVSGMQKVILTTIAKFTGRSFKIFERPDDAMSWLAKQ